MLIKWGKVCETNKLLNVQIKEHSKKEEDLTSKDVSLESELVIKNSRITFLNSTLKFTQVDLPKQTEGHMKSNFINCVQKRPRDKSGCDKVLRTKFNKTVFVQGPT